MELGTEQKVLSLKDLPTGKRVLLLCTASSIGGTERVVMDHALALMNAGHEVHTRIAVSDSSIGTLKWFAENGVDAKADPRLLDVHIPRSRADMPQLTALVREIAPEVVVIHFGVNHISLKDILAIRLARPKRLFAHLHHPSPLDGMPQKTHIMTRYASRFCDGVIHATEIIKRQMISIGVSEKKMRFVPYAIPVPASMPDPTIARRTWGFGDDDFVISCLSRIEVEKGIGELIDACALAQSEIPNIRLLIGGSGAALDEMRAKAKDAMGDRALVPGRIQSTSDLFAASNVFSLPSYLEGFGLVYLEAAHFGIPSIGTDVGGIPEAIVDGKTGLLVPVKDIDALSRAIIQLYRDPVTTKAFGRAAKERVCEDFSPEAAQVSLQKVLFE